MAVGIFCSFPAFGQSIGEVTSIDFAGGRAALTLDFTVRDYELILYSTVTEGGDTNVFRYKVSGKLAAGDAEGIQSQAHAVVADRDRLESVLREEERELAARRMRQDRRSPTVRKAKRQISPMTFRTFAFNAFGELKEDQTVEATLVASSSLAVAYADVAMVDSMAFTAADVQAMLDTFSAITYPKVTEVFGKPSDVDGDGKVLLLFTPLVDKVGGISGFYRSQSLFARIEGGDGNKADMMYISPTQTLDSYKSLIAHEFQHLINFNQHALMRSARSEESWLNEALSVVTEDLVSGYLEGGNPELVKTYLYSPQDYSMTGSAQFNKGIRGAGYLFLRGLMEDFGEDILGRLAQTALAGTLNVEAVTGRGFLDLYARFAARTFLSGTWLAPEFNYRFPYFTEPTAGQRTLPLTRETVFALTGAPVEGQLRPAASVYLRLTGNESEGLVNIETEEAGAFRALLIPIPREFKPRLALAADYFSKLRFDAPLQAGYASGKGERISGAVVDTSISRLFFRFRSIEQTGSNDEITFAFDVKDGRFSRSIIFDPSHAGEYELIIDSPRFAGDDSLPWRFSPVTVTEGNSPVFFPVDFFPGLTLDSVIPAVVQAGVGLRISGVVRDPLVSEMQLSYRPFGRVGEYVDFSFDVTSGRFGRSIVFNGAQAGEYEIRLSLIKTGGSPASVERYSPFTVTEGSGTVEIPVDFFSGIIFDAPFPSALAAGEGLRISGSIPDSSVSQVLFSFRPLGDSGRSAEFSFAVTGGRFGRSIVFDPSQSGDYELTLYKGQNGHALPFAGKFHPITITKGSGTVKIPVDFSMGVIFDAPLPNVLSAGDGVRISGVIPDPLVTQVLFSFRRLGGTGLNADFFFDVMDGRFGRSIVFDPSQAGDYELILFKGRKGETLPFSGRFSPITITEGSGIVRIPVDFVSGVILDAPLPGVFRVGEGVRISGAVSDPLVSQVLFRFRLLGETGSSVDFFFDVTDGRFGHGIVFLPSQIGDTELILFKGRKGEALVFAGQFSPITIAEGSGTIRVPVDFFQGITLDFPLTDVYRTGKEIRISGNVSDPSITQVLFSFELRDAAETRAVWFFAPVANSRFDRVITFEPSQAGQYELFLYKGKVGEPLSFSGRLDLVSVTLPVRPSIVGVTAREDGSLELRIRCEPGKGVAVEVSTDFAAWTLLSEEIVPPDGEWTTRDALAAKFEHRFYRIRVLSP